MSGGFSTVYVPAVQYNQLRTTREAVFPKVNKVEVDQLNINTAGQINNNVLSKNSSTKEGQHEHKKVKKTGPKGKKRSQDQQQKERRRISQRTA